MSTFPIENFITNFFQAYDCQVNHQKNGIINVQLNEQLDKALMNRPFYWHYMKSTGQAGQPMSLSLLTKPEHKNEQGQWADIGTPLIQQMFDYVTTEEKYGLFFQAIETKKNTPLYPWLLTNLKISYTGKQKKEELISLGIQLLNGKIIVNMMDELNRTTLKQQISNFCYTLSPIITIASGYRRIEKVILNYIEGQDKSWAEETIKMREEEIELLHHFYQNDLEDDTIKKEINEIKERYTPEISVEVVNGGLIYLLGDFV